jgi:hypothetical protein
MATTPKLMNFSAAAAGGQLAHGHARADLGPQMGDVGRLAGRVDDQEEVIAAVGDHQVVENAARVVRKQRIARAPDTEPGDIARHKRFESGGSAVALQADLPHVRHIEQRGAGARMVVFGDDAGGILHRHLVAGELHELGAQLAVQRVEGRALKSGGGGRVIGHGSRILRQSAGCGSGRGIAASLRPLCPVT